MCFLKIHFENPLAIIQFFFITPIIKSECMHILINNLSCYLIFAKSIKINLLYIILYRPLHDLFISPFFTPSPGTNCNQVVPFGALHWFFYTCHNPLQNDCQLSQRHIRFWQKFLSSFKYGRLFPYFQWVQSVINDNLWQLMTQMSDTLCFLCLSFTNTFPLSLSFGQINKPVLFVLTHLLKPCQNVLLVIFKSFFKKGQIPTRQPEVLHPE